MATDQKKSRIRHVRKGDLVYVRSGSDRGTTAKVLRVLPGQNLVVVEGVNVRKKNLKPSQRQQQGGVTEKEMAIHVSNVSPVADGKPTRVRIRQEADGSRVRVAVRNGEVLGAPLRKAR